MSYLYKSNKTEVRKSFKHGFGLFAKKDIKKDELISIKTGHIIHKRQLNKIQKECGDFWIQIDDNFFLSPLTKKEAKESALYINHSCEPNVGCEGDIKLVAIKNIKKGEELCYDYAMDTSTNYSLICMCNNKNCRKIITGEDWKLKELQEKYQNYFAYYLLKKIKGSIF